MYVTFFVASIITMHQTKGWSERAQHLCAHLKSFKVELQHAACLGSHRAFRTHSSGRHLRTQQVSLAGPVFVASRGMCLRCLVIIYKNFKRAPQNGLYRGGKRAPHELGRDDAPVRYWQAAVPYVRHERRRAIGTHGARACAPRRVEEAASAAPAQLPVSPGQTVAQPSPAPLPCIVAACPTTAVCASEKSGWDPADELRHASCHKPQETPVLYQPTSNRPQSFDFSVSKKQSNLALKLAGVMGLWDAPPPPSPLSPFSHAPMYLAREGAALSALWFLRVLLKSVGLSNSCARSVWTAVAEDSRVCDFSVTRKQFLDWPCS